MSDFEAAVRTARNFLRDKQDPNPTFKWGCGENDFVHQTSMVYEMSKAEVRAALRAAEQLELEQDEEIIAAMSDDDIEAMFDENTKDDDYFLAAED